MPVFWFDPTPEKNCVGSCVELVIHEAQLNRHLRNTSRASNQQISLNVTEFLAWKIKILPMHCMGLRSSLTTGPSRPLHSPWAPPSRYLPLPPPPGSFCLPGLRRRATCSSPAFLASFWIAAALKRHGPSKHASMPLDWCLYRQPMK